MPEKDRRKAAARDLAMTVSLQPNPVIKRVTQPTGESPVGGIDFNSANLNLQIKRDGAGVPLPVSQQDMAQLNRIQGFEPEIIEIRPALSLPIFSELQGMAKPTGG